MVPLKTTEQQPKQFPVEYTMLYKAMHYKQHKE